MLTKSTGMLSSPSSYTTRQGRVIDPNCLRTQIGQRFFHYSPCPSFLEALHPEFLFRASLITHGFLERGFVTTTSRSDLSFRLATTKHKHSALSSIERISIMPKLSPAKTMPDLTNAEGLERLESPKYHECWATWSQTSRTTQAP